MKVALRVLLVPDSVFWVTGTICVSIAKHNPWLRSTVISGGLLNRALHDIPDLFSRFDLVHFVCPYASRAWLPRLRDTHAIVTTHHHVTDWELQKHNLDGDAIMTDSAEWLEDLLRRGVEAHRVVSVPPGVDCELFAPRPSDVRARVRSRYHIASEEMAIGFFGKSSSNELGRKGVDVMIAAARQLRGSGTRFTLVMTGPGWGEVVAELRGAGICVVWESFVRERRDLADLYGALDCYWITSRIEGGPVTLLEAMSTELCCIATPVGLVHEIVRDGQNAMVVPVGDAAAVAEATATLAADTDKRASLGRRARLDVSARFASAITMQRVGDLYGRALKRFSERTGRPGPMPPTLPPRPLSRLQDWPLESVPAHLRAALRRREALAWADNLWQYQSEPMEALRVIADELRRSPLERETWRALLRNVLPQPLVKLHVRATSSR